MAKNFVAVEETLMHQKSKCAWADFQPLFSAFILT